MKRYKIRYYRKRGLQNYLLRRKRLSCWLNIDKIKHALNDIIVYEGWFLHRYYMKFKKTPDGWKSGALLLERIGDIKEDDYNTLLKHSRLIDEYIEQFRKTKCNRNEDKKVCELQHKFEHSYYDMADEWDINRDIIIDANIKSDRKKYFKDGCKINKRTIHRHGYSYEIEVEEYHHSCPNFVSRGKWMDAFFFQLEEKQVFSFASLCKHRHIRFNSKRYNHYRDRVYNGLRVRDYKENSFEYWFLSTQIAIIYMTLEQLATYKNIPRKNLDFLKRNHPIFGDDYYTQINQQN